MDTIVQFADLPTKQPGVVEFMKESGVPPRVEELLRRAASLKQYIVSRSPAPPAPTSPSPVTTALVASNPSASSSSLSVSQPAQSPMTAIPATSSVSAKLEPVVAENPYVSAIKNSPITYASKSLAILHWGFPESVEIARNEFFSIFLMFS